MREEGREGWQVAPRGLRGEGWNSFVEKVGGDVDGVREGSREGTEGEVKLIEMSGERGNDEADLLVGGKGGFCGDATAEDSNGFRWVHVDLKRWEFESSRGRSTGGNGATAVGWGRGEDSAWFDNNQATAGLSPEDVRDGGVKSCSGICGGICGRVGVICLVVIAVVTIAAAIAIAAVAIAVAIDVATAGADGPLDEAEATLSFEDCVLGLL